ncbi:MAG TPA: DUF952 domain-containing protein [Ferruginibacter sp.]|nr:DUF952 domain-containing protein [Ferruginibacter sp.]
MIYHVVSKTDWQQALEQGEYKAASLATEGFIHASKAHQVSGVLERYFKGKSDLLLLHIDEHKLTAPFTYELSPSVNEEFPHIFGPINLDAVLKVQSI